MVALHITHISDMAENVEQGLFSMALSKTLLIAA